MRVHYLQHVSFEDLGILSEQLQQKGHTVTCTQLFKNEPLPNMDDFDWLIVMGGAMGIFDEAANPWLAHEKHFIKTAIDAEKTVIGICLGAQLIAHVLGARVFPNPQREIGWYAIEPSDEISSSALGSVFHKPMEVFHWHSDTFDLPEGAIPIGSSEACRQQGFVYNNTVIALQFHIETTATGVSGMLENCGDDLDESRFVQTGSHILAQPNRFSNINEVARKMIEALGA